MACRTLSGAAQAVDCLRNVKIELVMSLHAPYALRQPFAWADND